MHQQGHTFRQLPCSHFTSDQIIFTFFITSTFTQILVSMLHEWESEICLYWSDCWALMFKTKPSDQKSTCKTKAGGILDILITFVTISLTPFEYTLTHIKTWTNHLSVHQLNIVRNTTYHSLLRSHTLSTVLMFIKQLLYVTHSAASSTVKDGHHKAKTNWIITAVTSVFKPMMCTKSAS